MRLTLTSSYLAIMLIIASSIWRNDANAAASIDDAASALEDFLTKFDAVEEKSLNDQKNYFKAVESNIKEEVALQEQELRSKELEKLAASAALYERIWQSDAVISEKIKAKLSLLQTWLVWSKALPKGDPNVKKMINMGLMLAAADPHPTKEEQKAHHQYLKSLLLEAAGKNDDAYQSYQTLASSQLKAVFTAYANVKLGDLAFAREQPERAKVHYHAALTILRTLKFPDDRKDIAHIKYRLAWSNYRTANLEQAITFSAQLLRPGLRSDSDRTLESIRQDGVSLVGNSLYELNDYDLIKKTLSTAISPYYASKVGTVILNRYYNAELLEQQLSFASFLSDKFRLAPDLPLWIVINAQAADKLKRISDRYSYYEQVASLLPKNSLWRQKNKAERVGHAIIDERGVGLSQEAADYYYEQGIKSSGTTQFTRAAAIYANLREYVPEHKDSNYWRSREAHCYYFSGNYARAEIEYRKLIATRKLEPTTLEIASYQLVLSIERQWRVAFQSEPAARPNAQAHTAATEKINQMEESVNDFANRFPNTSRSSELLLAMASAFRDTERYADARMYWERVLVAQPTSAQRALAIRGIILASLQANTTAEVVALSERFLKLEDWKELGNDLRNELEGVLSAATVDEASKQNRNGNVAGAGVLMARIAEQNKDIPQREKILRDGAYTLALSGDWASALQMSENYLGQGLKAFEGDMMYLKARALEFQLSFDAAAKTYLSFAKKYPKHKHTTTSLERALGLADNEEMPDIAAEAAERLSRTAPKLATKAYYLETAHREYLMHGDADKAIRVAGKYKTIGTSADIRLNAQLLEAKALMKSAREEQGIKQLETLAVTLRKNKPQLRLTVYQKLAGETNFILGDEYAKRMYDYKMEERSGSISDRIKQKTAYYEAASRAFDFATATTDPSWASKARYEHALASESFGDELNAFINDHKETVGSRYTALKDMSDRLRTLAKRYHTENVIARAKNPQAYRDNEWVRLSALRVSSGNAGQGETPSVVGSTYEMPTGWSM